MSMSHRLQILLNHQEYSSVKRTSSRDGKSISDWVREIIREKLSRKDQKMDIVSELCPLNLPAPSIDQMLDEIEKGRQ